MNPSHKKEIKYVFLGTPEFASIILEKLIAADLSPALIICNPDRPAGRKHLLTPPPAKIIAEKYNLPFYQPEKLSAEKLKEKISGTEFAVVAAYGKIISQKSLDLFPKGVIGVHPSLLPKYRGATPLQSVLLKGSKNTGVSLFMIDKEVDHGPILAKEKMLIDPEDNYQTLMRKAALVGADLLIKTLSDFSAGKIKPKKQNHKIATFTEKFETSDAFVPFDDLVASVEKDKAKAKIIERKIRAFYPEPGVFTMKEISAQPRRIKILKAILTPNKKLKILIIQPEGQKPHPLNPPAGGGGQIDIF
ncbi:MAG: methionyl-tRNA formyltransferase [bacterium]|nr:methionyl-tRNA formyltransferase [bacterium]